MFIKILKSKRLLFSVAFFVSACFVSSFARSINLTTIMPDQSILRVERAVVGNNPDDPNWDYSEINIPADSLLVGGNMGIGTDSPRGPLEIAYKPSISISTATLLVGRWGDTASIKATGQADGHLVLDGWGAGTAGGVYLNSYNPGNVVLAKGGGDVGIGTDAPRYKLHVQGGFITTTEDFFHFAGSGSSYGYGSGLRLLPEQETGEHPYYLQVVNEGELQTNDFFIQPIGGNVGIGVNMNSGIFPDLDNQLRVDGSAKIDEYLTIGDEVSGVTNETTPNDGGMFLSGEMRLGNSDASQHLIDGVYQPMIYSSKSGGSLPGSSWLVLQSGDANWTGRGILFATSPDPNSGIQESMKLDGDGNLDIAGKLSLSHRIITDVDDGNHFWIKSAGTIDESDLLAFGFQTEDDGKIKNSFIRSNGENRLVATPSGGRLIGSWTIDSGIAITSDITLKDNIRNLSHGIDEVMKMQPREFTLKSNGLRNIGFIAQELEEIIPEVVVTGSEGKKAVTYGNLAALLTNALQQQQEEIKSQQKTIEELKRDIAELRNDISKIISQ